MIDILRQHIIKRLGNNTDQLETVLSCFQPLTAKRNQFLLKEGETCRYVYFIAKGSLQVFVYDTEMNETTRDLILEDNWCTELMSFGTGKPASENIRTIEPVILLAINQSDFQQMVSTVPSFNSVYKQILEASYANSVYRINSFISLSALERVQWLQVNRPMLMSRLSGKLIASYLGISQETFSRLKAKL